MPTVHRVEWIAHRGAKRERHENTLAAFEQAFARGADAVELDVHRTRDGVVVVHHDPIVRLSDGAARVIAECTARDLASLELADGARVPRLVDVLAMVPSGARVYVELKGADVGAVAASAIRASRPAAVECAVHSFDHAVVERMAAIAPEIPRGLLFEHSVPELAPLIVRTGARDLWPHHSLVTAALVRDAHTRGARVLTWTVNDRGVAERLTALGVDGLCGDDVRLFDGL